MVALAKWLILTLVILATPYLISGVQVQGFGAALAAAAVISILNLILKPILFLITLPLTIITLGLFLFVINAFLFQLASFLVTGFTVSSFGSALLASLVVSFVNWVMSFSIEQHEGRRRIVFVQKNDRKRIVSDTQE